MKNKKKSTEKRVEKYDELLFDFESQLEELQDLRKKLKKIQKQADELTHYMYSEDWMKDFDKYEGKEDFHVLGEDYLYNALIDFENEKVKILKQICKHL
ncbi:DUF4298 domain-containing protein [Elizabethkingia sp. JS20170427COW]|uniref:DUF4298 domain-containing protein n=1 Tax=Elizabethkingia sp. JS20170427COW TaxID=2583851 RepID=UPI0011101F94|nr:DUF4298 domain-containing protein [Elizabethkingia sp. JS20170427COW]QCX52600.1 DUF4298 domain-containing protein [Elizabethkingia sp. JS20170427COW]